MTFVGARLTNMGIGIWLVVSSFLWRHSYAQFTNSWVVGLLCVLAAGLALTFPRARFANTALGAWLALSAFFLPWNGLVTVWHNAVVGAVIFALSLVPGGQATSLRGRPVLP